MAKITVKQGKISVPNNPTIPFIEGDGVGREVTQAMREIVDAAILKCYGGERAIEWMEVMAGGKSFDATGEWLPEATLDAFSDYIVGIKGPLTTPVGGGIRSLNVAMRQTLDLYVCLRPVRWFRGVASPIKEPQKVDMVIFRENTEDIYAGIEWEEGTPEARKFLKFLTEEMGVTQVRFPETSSFGVKPISKQGTQRLVVAAIEHALKNNLPCVTIVHKGNIMKYTEGGFKRWGYEVAQSRFGEKVYTMQQYETTKKEHGVQRAESDLEGARAQGRVVINDVIADAFLQNTLLTPEKYSVIATLNLNGDYISDQLAAMVGGIGIAPGGNINYVTGHAVFEATHGTAPDIAERNVVNPCSLLLSAVMMLDYMGWTQAGQEINRALENLFESGRATADLARFMTNGVSLSTSDFTNEVVNNLNQ